MWQKELGGGEFNRLALQPRPGPADPQPGPRGPGDHEEAGRAAWADWGAGDRQLRKVPCEGLCGIRAAVCDGKQGALGLVQGGPLGMWCGWEGRPCKSPPIRSEPPPSDLQIQTHWTGVTQSPGERGWQKNSRLAIQVSQQVPRASLTPSQPPRQAGYVGGLKLAPGTSSAWSPGPSPPADTAMLWAPLRRSRPPRPAASGHGRGRKTREQILTTVRPHFEPSAEHTAYAINTEVACKPSVRQMQNVDSFTDGETEAQKEAMRKKSCF